ncbi:MAG: hypothetical protein HKP58_06480 [Desulfatitalea sp.]|nr:hypothetical protein [Desulfatitalea sp.]NNK00043.1 hypothetical protein [Desulfatitalea sp.]
MTEYQKTTDEDHQVKLGSKLVHALWISRAVCVHEKAPFEVYTHFVGNGADIQVEVIDKKGKTIKKVKGNVYGNYFSDAIVIPDKAEAALMFVAKLPKHKLERKSDICLILPPVKILNQKWGQKQARRGDTVRLTADVENIPDGSEVMIFIYEYDRDGAHDHITRFPCRIENRQINLEWNYAYHEDTDEIPTDEEMKKHSRRYNPPEYFWVAEYGRKRFGDQQESGLLEFKDWIRIELKDELGAGVGNEQYILHLPDGSSKKGSLNDEGVAEEKDVPPGKVDIEYKGAGKR